MGAYKNILNLNFKNYDKNFHKSVVVVTLGASS